MVAYSFKKRFVDPIRQGLGTRQPILGLEPAFIYPKCQTIRAIGKRRHAHPGNVIQLYCGMRTRQCFKIGEARCTSVHSVTIDVRQNSMPTSLDGVHIGGGRLRDFARADGFEHAEAMLEFWKKEHGLGRFNGLLIRWEPIR